MTSETVAVPAGTSIGGRASSTLDREGRPTVDREGRRRARRRGRQGRHLDYQLGVDEPDGRSLIGCKLQIGSRSPQRCAHAGRGRAHRDGGKGPVQHRRRDLGHMVDPDLGLDHSTLGLERHRNSVLPYPALGAFSLGLPRSRAAQLRQTGLVLRQARRARREGRLMRDQDALVRTSVHPPSESLACPAEPCGPVDAARAASASRRASSRAVLRSSEAIHWK